MTPTVWLMLAVCVLGAILTGLALVAFRPGQDLERRPLPYPRSHRHRRRRQPLEVPAQAWTTGEDSMEWLLPNRKPGVWL